MTDLYAYDAAYAPDLNVIKANNGVALNCYIAGQYAVDGAWVNKVRAAGIGPWPNYEVGLWELVSDRATGKAAASKAIAAAKACGFPNNGTVYFPFSVDVSVNPTDYSKVGAAFQGINDVNNGQYLIACYGQGGLIDYLRAKNLTQAKGWLSASSSYPGWNPDSPNVCLVQGHRKINNNWQYVQSPVNGTDQNTITDITALKAWWPLGTPYVTKEGFLMALSDAKQDEVYNLIKRLSFGLDNGESVPYSVRGEIVTRLRSIDTNVDAKISSAVSAAKATTLTPSAIAAAVVEALPPHPTKEDIAAAVIAVLPSENGGPVQYEGTVQLTPKTS